eukprot:1605333-Rhodomonas_salina.1
MHLLQSTQRQHLFLGQRFQVCASGLAHQGSLYADWSACQQPQHWLTLLYVACKVLALGSDGRRVDSERKQSSVNIYSIRGAVAGPKGQAYELWLLRQPGSAPPADSQLLSPCSSRSPCWVCHTCSGYQDASSAHPPTASSSSTG